jgi:hypothetical protein
MKSSVKWITNYLESLTQDADERMSAMHILQGDAVSEMAKDVLYIKVGLFGFYIDLP